MIETWLLCKKMSQNVTDSRLLMIILRVAIVKCLSGIKWGVNNPICNMEFRGHTKRRMCLQNNSIMHTKQT